MSHIFISYSHKDKKYVEKLEGKLIEEGFNVWIDHNIDYGDEWLKVIQKKLDECDAYIIVMSKNSFESYMVQNEVTRAREKNKNLFSLLLDGENWLIVQAKQYVDVTGGSLPPEGFYKRLEKVTPRIKNIQASNNKSKENDEKKSEADKLFSEATQLNINGYAERSLQLYRKVKDIEPYYPDVDLMIRNLEKEVSGGLVASNGRIYIDEMRKEAKPITTDRRLSPTLVVGIIAIFILFITNFFSSSIRQFFNQIQVDITTTATKSGTAPIMATGSKTSVAPTMTPTHLPSEIIDNSGVPIVYIPAGEFVMGSENGGNDEKPVHHVFLDNYYIDKYEVTNAQYKTCVDNGHCAPPTQTNTYTQPIYYGNPEFDDYPVIYVDWNMAKSYCEWREARLPTEAEWEKAARGFDSPTYPWGNEFYPSYANYNKYFDSTAPVGFFVYDQSNFGVYDMAGNVSEWVADWYDDDYYTSAPATNPLGPNEGQIRVLRGGSWYDDDNKLRSSYRTGSYPTDTNSAIGFRCVRSATP